MKARTSLALVALVLLIATAALTVFVGRDHQPGFIAFETQRAPVSTFDGNSVQTVSQIPGDAGATTKPPLVRDWLRSYHESTNNLALALELVDAAALGDARAEFVLGRILLRCEIYKRTLAPYAEGTVAERIERHLAAQPNLAVFGGSRFRREAQRCEGLLVDNPFAEYDLPEQATNFQYWAERAVGSGDPLAAMDHASRLVGTRSETDDPEKSRAYREALMNDVRVAVLSKDAGALFAVGALFSHPSLVADPEYGYAWQVAACESGYDCSNANPEIGLGCVVDSSCVDDLTWLDKMQRDFGPTKYAEIYANAQDIQYKIRTDDWDGLQQYLKIK
jgi:hypothetical protein